MPRHARPDEPDPEPDDELLQLLADPDAFVRGGRHEPAARTREALARHGDRTTSWRQAAPLTATPPARRRRRRPHRRARPRWVVVVALVVAGSAVFGIGRWALGAGPDTGSDVVAPPPAVAPAHPPILAGTATASAGATTSVPPDVHGITERTPVGTCFLAPTEDADLTEVSCARAHDVEVVSHEQATGADDAYPADAYWNGPVLTRCYADAKDYVGGERSAWPAGAEPRFYRPSAASWQLGDRDLECVVRLTPAAPGSVRGTAGRAPVHA